MGAVGIFGELAVWTNAEYKEIAGEHDFYLDMEFGTDTDDEGNNTFSVQLPEDVRLSQDGAFFVDGTEYGGLIQRRVSDTAQDVLQWEGRTWQGVLADRIVQPAAGNDYFTLSGTDEQCITALISHLGLSSLFDVGDTTGTSISFQFPRYCDGFVGLCKMLASASLKPTFSVSRTGGTVSVLVGASAQLTLGEAADGEVADVQMSAEFTPYNHVIALGQGELRDREVVHRYADVYGNISGTQTITGLRERVLVYDNPSAESSDLIEGAEERLRECQGQGTVEVLLEDGFEADICDMVAAYDQRINASVTALVTKKVIQIENGELSVACEAGGQL